MVSPQNISKIKGPKKLPEIEWNDKDITAYTDLGLGGTGDSWPVGK